MFLELGTKHPACVRSKNKENTKMVVEILRDTSNRINGPNEENIFNKITARNTQILASNK